MENNDDGRRAVSAETFYGTHESENNMVMSEKVINFVRIFSQLLNLCRNMVQHKRYSYCHCFH